MRVAHAKTLLVGALALIAAAAAWFYFAPVALGGSTTYVVTDGISMEPHFHAGDLVLVRSQSSYHVGEIVAYRSTLLHTLVLHRIVGRDGPAYLFKGDNNDFIDPEHPLRSQLVGALWLHLAGVGTRLEALRSPPMVGALVGVGMLLCFSAAFAGRRRRRRRRPASAGSSAPPAQRPRRHGPVGGVVAAGFVALLPFAMLALISFTRATAALLPFSVPYQQSGAFSYSAHASAGPVYPGNRVVTGAPLFTRLLRTVHVRFAYAFRAAAAHSVSGNVALYATLSSTSGWQRTITLERPTPFRGGRARATATLDVGALSNLASGIEAATSVSGVYTLALTPHVSVAGSVGGVPLHTSYSPTLPFSLSQFEIQQTVAASATPGAPAAASSLDPSASGSVTARRYEPTYLSFRVVRLSVSTARWVGLGGGVIVLIALLATVVLMRRRRLDEAAAIRARYRRWIVPVTRVRRRAGVATVDVAEVGALVRIAERYDRMILHEAGVAGEAFWVVDESGQFRYAVGVSDRAIDAEGARGAEPRDHREVGVEAHGETAEEPAATLGDGTSGGRGRLVDAGGEELSVVLGAVGSAPREGVRLSDGRDGQGALGEAGRWPDGSEGGEVGREVRPQPEPVVTVPVEALTRSLAAGGADVDGESLSRDLPRDGVGEIDGDAGSHRSRTARIAPHGGQPVSRRRAVSERESARHGQRSGGLASKLLGLWILAAGVALMGGRGGRRRPRR